MGRIAFLGLGRMGAAMAHHLLAAGHELTVWNRTAGRAAALVAAGAREERSVGDAVRGADAVVLMLFGPDSVREVLPQVLAAAPPGALVINSTTVGPDDARQFAATCGAHGARYVDAPVTGSVGPAREGTLGVLAGCAEQDWPAAEPLLQCWGAADRVRRVGEVGAGSSLKLVVNQGIGVLAAGLGEALRLAAELGLDRAATLDALEAGAYAWTLRQKRAMIDSDDYADAHFSAELLAKDLDLALRAAPSAELAVTRATLQDVAAAVAAGRGGQDYASVIGHVAGPSRRD